GAMAWISAGLLDNSPHASRFRIAMATSQAEARLQPEPTACLSASHGREISRIEPEYHHRTQAEK
ncbi:hypothetical protein, partial [Mesorhizobium sp. M7A.F.Ca.CA.001.09.2.1]|uniref:hypothetical protein n=1 Tax=Mesorhizobium sp. M7A.F.Ca.CA.001.09.2.1 TaxID=2496719 RepID=UPI0019D12FB3